jgi:prepilin-type N-terminal cleavage/methylation domain-containing protein
MDSCRKDTAGFTLIEILIVLVILGILASIVIFASGAFIGDGKNSACQANAKILNTAEAAYSAQHLGTRAQGDAAKLTPYLTDGFPTENVPTFVGGHWGCS